MGEDSHSLSIRTIKLDGEKTITTTKTFNKISDNVDSDTLRGFANAYAAMCDCDSFQVYLTVKSFIEEE